MLCKKSKKTAKNTHIIVAEYIAQTQTRTNWRKNSCMNKYCIYKQTYIKCKNDNQIK